MAPHKFVLDEDVSHGLARLLRLNGLNVDSAKELRRLGLRDPQVLLRAAEDGCALITHNNKDFRALHEAWVTWRQRWSDEVQRATGRSIDFSQHAGIVIVPHGPTRELASLVVEFDGSFDALNDRCFAWTPTLRWHEVEQ